MNRWRFRPLGVAVATIVVCAAARLTLLGAPAGDRAEFVQPNQDDRAASRAEADDPQSSRRAAAEGQNVFVPPDRTTLRLLNNAQQLADQGRYAEAVRCLGAILESSQDYFFARERDDPVPRSLRLEAERLLGEMSDRGRELYELQYGARARQMLVEAVAAGDSASLAEVSRRFFHTRAGYEATLLLGLNHLDHGRPLAGALVLERLRQVPLVADEFEPALSLAMATCWVRAGMPQEARDVLSLLKARYPDATIEVAGREVSLFVEGADPLEWLTEVVGPQMTTSVEATGQWALFRGNARRNALSSGGGPLLSIRWRVLATDHPLVEALVEQIRESDAEWDRSALPALHPLVVDDVVLMRTVRNLLAVDSHTGKRLWRVPVDDPFETLLDAFEDSRYGRIPQLEMAIRLRVWADATYGQMSSDGQCVFAVEDLGLELGAFQFPAALMGPRRRDDATGPRSYNRLAAYDLRTGKLAWHVGGSTEDLGLPQAGSFFLGPPLPLMGRLYAIAEIMGEIRLMALEDKSGDLLWSQQLAGTDQPLLKDPLRRMAGITPSYADGVLICPTGNRSIVAVDLATRSLLWGYAYPQAGRQAQRRLMFPGARTVLDANPDGRWIDSSVILAEGRVLATPLESDHLVCLSLLDGSLLWKEPRQGDFYLACVHEGDVVLVGKHRVRALDLHQTRDESAEENAQEAADDASSKEAYTQPEVPRPAPAWGGRAVEFASEVTPSGIGYRSGNRYYVPLTSGEIIAVDLETGRPARVFKPRQGLVPGNLICHQGKVFSQNATGLEAFDQLSALRDQVDRRLAATGDDAEALALRGEILWDEGDLEGAIGCFRRSLELQPAPNTRRLLRETLFHGLQTQFAVQRRDVDEIGGLIDEPGQQAKYLRLMAAGLESAGEFRPALEHYLELITLDRDHRDMEAVDESLLVRRDRWIQVQLAALHEAAPAEVKAEIDRVAAARFEAAVNEGDAGAIERFLDYWSAHPIAADARAELVRQHQGSGALLAAELLLRRDEQSDVAEVRARAVAELAQMLGRSGRSRDAAVCYRRLKEEFADVVCLGEKTGRELVEALPEDDPVRDRLQPDPAWPTGKVLVTRTTVERRRQSRYGQPPLAYHGTRRPYFSETTVELQQHPPQLVARDGLGNRQWGLSLIELAGTGDFLFGRGLMGVGVCGHLLLLTSGERILAIDTLGTTAERFPRLLWSRDLDRPPADLPARGRLGVQLANPAGVAPLIDLARQARDPIQVSGTWNERVLCVKRFRNCIAVDPMTGDTLWIRKNIPRDSEVFGDHEYVFVAPSGRTTATVLRAVDGKMLGQREVPLGRQMTFGRRVLVWETVGSRQVLELVDAWDSRTLWRSQEFAADAALHPVGEDAVAVYDPPGRLVLVNLDDGRAVIDAELKAQQLFPEVLVLPSPDGYLVVAYDQRPEANQSRRPYPLQGVPSVRVNRGQVYAFDRQGGKLWPSPVTVQEQWLPLDQPYRLPVLAFACVVQHREGGRSQSETSILGIDKRTGREICREEFPHVTSGLTLVGDAEKKTVELQLQGATVTLAFTDQPASSGSEMGSSADDESSGPAKKPTTAGAIWRAVRAAVTGSASGSD